MILFYYLVLILLGVAQIAGLFVIPAIFWWAAVLLPLVIIVVYGVVILGIALWATGAKIG